jgi:hypothetical protein
MNFATSIKCVDADKAYDDANKAYADALKACNAADKACTDAEIVYNDADKAVIDAYKANSAAKTSNTNPFATVIFGVGWVYTIACLMNALVGILANWITSSYKSLSQSFNKIDDTETIAVLTAVLTAVFSVVVIYTIVVVLHTIADTAEADRDTANTRADAAEADRDTANTRADAAEADRDAAELALFNDAQVIKKLQDQLIGATNASRTVSRDNTDCKPRQHKL